VEELTLRQRQKLCAIRLRAWGLRQRKSGVLNGQPRQEAPGQSLQKALTQGWATSPKAAALAAAPAEKAGPSGHNRTALRHPPRQQRGHACQPKQKADLKFEVKKPSQDCNDGP